MFTSKMSSSVLSAMLWSAAIPSNPEYDSDEGLQAIRSYLDKESGSKAYDALWEAYMLFLPKRDADVLRELKANASGWMHDVFPETDKFSWQRGYGAFTVSQSNVDEVRRYIANQKEHHKRTTFRDQFIQFLQANQIEYDERYL